MTGLYSDVYLGAVRRTLEIEGGLVDDPVDRGGRTNYGITARTLRHYNNLTGRTLRMEGLNHVDVLAIYHTLYWTKGHVNEMPTWAQPIMFDWMVHSGIWRATALMQGVIGAKPDGLLGPRTLRALEAAGRVSTPEYAVNRLAIRRMRHLCGIVQHDPTQSRFIKGWWRRVSSFIS